MIHVEPSIVRIANPEDEMALVGLMCRLHQENGLFRMDAAKVQNKVRAILYKDVPGIIGVIGGDDLEGMIMLEIASVWYAPDDDRYIEEILSYVPPEHRRSGHAKSLIQFAKSCAEGLGLRLMIGVQSTDRMEAKVRLYQRQLPKLGEFFFYDPKGGE